MTLFTDGFNAGLQAMDYHMEKKKANSDTTLNIRMVRNGGFTAVVE